MISKTKFYIKNFSCPKVNSTFNQKLEFTFKNKFFNNDTKFTGLIKNNVVKL